MSLPKPTAAQDLLLDLLVARHRLGEPFWPISTQLTRTYRDLKQKGYVEIMDGYVSGTVRLSLTKEARKELMEDSGFTPACVRKHTEKIADELYEYGFKKASRHIVRKFRDA